MAAAIDARPRRPARALAGFVGCLALLAAASVGAEAEQAFVYVVHGNIESLDSAKASSERSIWVTWLLCDALLNISRDGNVLEPGLAESWTESRDGLHATFKLRPGVVFHDGAPVDASAVKASFERQFRADHKLYTAEPKNSKEKLLTELVRDIEIRDPLTVAFTLKYPGLHYLSQIDIVSPAALARLGKDFGRQPVCSGPFKIAGRSPNDIVLVAHERYWAGRPKIPRVVFRFVPEVKSVVEALLRGEADFTPTVRDPTSFERLRDSKHLRLLPVPGLNVYYLGFFAERPPFDNPVVRRAVAQALDLSRLVLYLGRGAAVTARGPLSPAMRGYDADAAQAPFAPEASRQALSASGWRADEVVRLIHDNAVTFETEVATAIQKDLRRVGMQIELLGKPGSPAVVAAARAREGDKGMFLYSWHLRAPYPERLLVPLFHSSTAGSTNLTGYRSPKVDNLLDAALRLPEGPDKNRLYAQVQRGIVEDAPMVFLYHLTRMAVHGERVRGLALNLGALPHDKLVTVDVVR